jgi:hypothetical protein
METDSDVIALETSESSDKFEGIFKRNTDVAEFGACFITEAKSCISALSTVHRLM